MGVENIESAGACPFEMADVIGNALLDHIGHVRMGRGYGKAGGAAGGLTERSQTPSDRAHAG